MTLLTDSIVKVAIKNDNQIPLLVEVDLKQPLSTLVKDICSRWNIVNSENYAFKYVETSLFLTEQNKLDMRNGAILTLQNSPSLVAEKVTNILSSDQQAEIHKILETLPPLCEDPTFAIEFINRKGLDFLVKLVEKGTEPSVVLSNALTSFIELMDHGVGNYDKISAKFVKKVSSNVTALNVDPRVLIKSLIILDGVIMSCPTMYNVVCSDVPLDNLISHLQSSNVEIQLGALSLTNSVFNRTSAEYRQRLCNELLVRGIRDIILTNILKKLNNIDDEMAHQLYLFQQVMFYPILEQTKITLNPDDQVTRDQLMIVYSTAFEGDNKTTTFSTNKMSISMINNFKRLGFSNPNLPFSDFNDKSIGSASFYSMIYFAKTYPDILQKLISENIGRDEEHEFAFIKSLNAVTKLLIEKFHFDEPTLETSTDYLTMMFTTDHPFEETFSVCIQLINKTWREMRASLADFTKVVSMVKEQVCRCLVERPSTIEQFKNSVFTLNYQTVLKLIQTESQERNILDCMIKPVVELREQLLPGLKDLVRQQRIGCLMEGQLFSIFAKGGKKEKNFYCQLSTNQRFLHHGESDEKILLESLPNKVPISEIKQIVMGKDCPHVKDVKNNKRACVTTSFSLLMKEEGSHLDFIAPNERVFSVWTDGLEALLGKPMSSKIAKEDVDCLLNMTMRVMLLDVENIQISDSQLQIPPEPANLNFYYQYGVTD